MNNKIHKLISNIILEYLLLEGSREQIIAGIADYLKENYENTEKRYLNLSVDGASLLDWSEREKKEYLKSIAQKILDTFSNSEVWDERQEQVEVTGKFVLVFVNFLFNFNFLDMNFFREIPESSREDASSYLDELGNRFRFLIFNKDVLKFFKEKGIDDCWRRYFAADIKVLAREYIDWNFLYPKLFKNSQQRWNDSGVWKYISSEISKIGIQESLGKDKIIEYDNGWSWLEVTNPDDNKFLCSIMNHCGEDLRGQLFYLLNDKNQPKFTITYNKREGAIREALGNSNVSLFDDRQTGYIDYVVDFAIKNKVKLIKFEKNELVGTTWNDEYAKNFEIFVNKLPKSIRVENFLDK